MPKPERTFWPSQPVPLEQGDIEGPVGAITKDTKKETPTEETPLPEGMHWEVYDTEGGLDELHHFLQTNYIKDSSSKFKFDYSKEFLSWYFATPSPLKLHIAIRGEGLIGFISALGVKVISRQMVIIDFLCVEEHHRAKGLAPILIQEVKRRTFLHGVYQAVYTAANVITAPLCSAQYYHRLLNVKKLLNVRFACVPRGTSEREFIMREKQGLLASLPENYRQSVKADVPQILAIMKAYYESEGVKYYQEFTRQGAEHMFLCKPDIIKTLVHTHEAPGGGKRGVVDGFVTYYTVDTSVEVSMKNRDNIHVAYLYAACRAPDGPSISDLVSVALSDAAKTGHDVFNVLTILDNKKFLSELRFGPGDGHLHYYLYNWRWDPATTAKDMALILF